MTSYPQRHYILWMDVFIPLDLLPFRSHWSFRLRSESANWREFNVGT